jgi:polysaccharide export outer membrane protein
MDVVYSAAPGLRPLLLGAVLLASVGALEARSVAADTYRVGPDDEIAINVLEDQALNVRRRVSTAGTVTLPLIGEVDVGNRTTEEIRLLLEAKLEESYLQVATVDVAVVDFRSQPISVLGAVREPGTVYLDGRWVLSQALRAAGGLADTHDGSVLIRRRSSKGLTDQLEVSLAGLIRGDDSSLDIPLAPDDVIRVPGAEKITIYFLGEVTTRGAITLAAGERASLMTAIARAGGLGERAASKLVIRRDRDGEGPLEIVADFRKIMAGKHPDIELEDGDFIVVKKAFL